MEPQARVGVDEAAVFVRDRYGDDAGDVAQLGGGDWSVAYSFRTGGRDLVIRFGRHVDDFEADRRAMAYRGPDVPVPAVLEIGEAFGGYYAVSERHFGVFLESLDEPGWGAVTPALLRALDALRALEPASDGVDPAGDGGTPDWHAWLLASIEDRPGSRTGGWREDLRRAPDIDRVFVAGERTLRTLVPACPAERHILHRDLLNRNVLVSADATQLEAVFDWGCSLAGDFMYEVAWFTFWAPWFPALAAVDFARAVEAHYARIGLVVENFRERLACYELQIGLEHIAYATFTRRPDSQVECARRTLQVLEELRA